jgi:protein gp37
MLTWETWNLWHGCRKISPGCQNCYVYRTDARFGRDSSAVARTKSFDLPVRKNRRGDYIVPSGNILYTCFTSDFFLEEADGWRAEAWRMIKMRPDRRFFIVTKRISRLDASLPDDWGGGYENVTVYATAENQAMADFRVPILIDAPDRHKGLSASRC